MRSRLSYLRKQNLLAPVFNNIYTFDVKYNFSPPVENNITKINNLLLKNFPYAQICFSETRWLNEFSVHQVFKSDIICMVEEFVTESIFYFLTEKGYRVIYHPNEKDVTYYLGSGGSVIITNLVSRSPVSKYKKVTIPTLEKLLVDAFTDTNIYFAFQDYELIRIFENAESKCNINFSLMLNYSRRRGNYNKLKSYLKTIFPQYESYL